VPRNAGPSNFRPPYSSAVEGQSARADLQAKLDAARMRLHEIVNLCMETRLPAETLRGLARGRDFFASSKRRLRRADEVGTSAHRLKL
jgi:hypothetical protein